MSPSTTSGTGPAAATGSGRRTAWTSDPLAPLLFACGLAPCLRELEEALQELAGARGLPRSSVRVLAYLDDVAVLTPPELAVEVLPTAQRVLGAFGLQLSLDKTQASSHAAARPAGLDERY